LLFTAQGGLIAQHLFPANPSTKLRIKAEKYRLSLFHYHYIIFTISFKPPVSLPAAALAEAGCPLFAPVTRKNEPN